MECNKLDGFYAVYLAAGSGEGCVLIAFEKGVATGADFGGFEYDGSYVLNGEQSIVVSLNVHMQPFQTSILGFSSGADGLQYSVKFELPQPFSFADVIRIETPYGPVNAKFKKLRNFPEVSD